MYLIKRDDRMTFNS